MERDVDGRRLARAWLTGAFLSAVYLVAESRLRGAPDLHRYFRVRAVVAGLAGLAAGAVALGALLADQRTMFDRVMGRSWPLLVLGVLALAATFLLAARGGDPLVAAGRGRRCRGARRAWAVAQYPYLLPFSLTIADGAARPVTLHWVLACSSWRCSPSGRHWDCCLCSTSARRWERTPTTSREVTLSSHR